MQYEQHPLGKFMPAMAKKEFEALCESIKRVGPLDDVIIYQQMVLDGWHVYLACAKVGRTPRFIEYSGDDALAFVEAKHTRRNLTPFQAGMVASEIKSAMVKRGKPKVEAGKEASHLLHVSPSTLARAEIIKANGTPAVKHAAANGASIKAMAEIASKPKSEQKVPPKKKKPTPLVEMRDAADMPVPMNLRDEFADRTIEELVASLKAMPAKVKQIAKWNPHILLATATEAIEAAIVAIDHAPHVVHQQCAGQGCKMCRKSGFLTKQAAYSEANNA